MDVVSCFVLSLLFGPICVAGQAKWPGRSEVQILDHLPSHHLKNLDQLRAHPLKKIDQVQGAASEFFVIVVEGLVGDLVPGG